MKKINSIRIGSNVKFKWMGQDTIGKVSYRLTANTLVVKVKRNPWSDVFDTYSISESQAIKV